KSVLGIFALISLWADGTFSSISQDVCRDFREFVTEGRLFCTRENDPIQGPDGRTHGNKCAMCWETSGKCLPLDHVCLQ
uniref:Kazal-like domain-containing protein n=1 Tax=Ornithorhynchus anatinus TaxID=9258 RepID=A0A6I8NVG6_ORNAN